LREIEEKIKKECNIFSLKESMDIFQNELTNKYIFKVSDKNLDLKERQDSWQWLNKDTRDWFDFYNGQIKEFNKQLEQFKKFSDEVVDQNKTFESLPLGTSRRELIEKAKTLGYTIAIHEIQRKSLAYLQPLINEFRRKSQSCIYLSQWLHTCVRPSLRIREKILVKCPKCSKVSHFDSTDHLKNIHACPYCLTMLSDGNIVKKEQELPKTTGECFCPFCGRLDPRQAEDCALQICSQCQHQMREIPTTASEKEQFPAYPSRQIPQVCVCQKCNYSEEGHGPCQDVLCPKCHIPLSMKFRNQPEKPTRPYQNP